jgi:hypothetical protein
MLRETTKNGQTLISQVQNIDLDDHAGVQHAGDVLKHRFSDDDTDPYDIHEILIHFQSHLGVDPGYDLL